MALHEISMGVEVSTLVNWGTCVRVVIIAKNTRASRSFC